MKKLFLTLISLILCFPCLLTVGCSSSIYDGKYMAVTEDEGVDFVKDVEKVSLSLNALEIEINSNIFGEKVESEFISVYTGNGIKMKGETEIYDIDVEFYYADGYLYSKSDLGGDSTRTKQKVNAEEAVFGGNTNYVHELVNATTMFDAKAMAEYFINVEGTVYYVESTKEYNRFKIEHTYELEVPELKSKLTTITTICYVFDESGRFITSKISIKTTRISRRLKEKSLIECTVKRFTGDIESTSSEELAKYTLFD